MSYSSKVSASDTTRFFFRRMDDKYLFKDATGQIIVDIDHEIFAGRTVTPQTKVRLSGKVDKDMMEPVKIDVKVLEILK